MPSEFKYELRMSSHCRRPAHVKKAFMKWLESKPEFKKRRPSPEEVIREARRKGSPLQGIFEQDVKKAALAHWRAEAQYLPRHIEVVKINVKTSEVITKPVRAFIPVEINIDGSIDEDKYIPAQRIARSKAAKQTVLDQAYRDLDAWINRYSRYEEFFSVFSGVVEAHRRISSKYWDRDAG